MITELAALDTVHQGLDDARTRLAEIQWTLEEEEPQWLLALQMLSTTIHELGVLMPFVVYRSRRQGHSWADVGLALGMTRQAAHERFAPRWPDSVVTSATELSE